MTFDKRQTNIAKGVAVLLLLWHHLFFNSASNYDDFKSLFYLKGIPVECFVADFCKICVAIFLFLSGYGLFKSYEKYLQKYEGNIKYDLLFIKNHLIKLMSGFWMIYIIFVPLGFLFNRNPIDIYHGNFLYAIIDFLGLESIFHTPTMNQTWWFMGLIIVLYVLYPMIHKLLKKFPEALLLTSYFALWLYFIPTELAGLRIYLFPFVLAMYFSYYNIFDRLHSKLNNSVNCFYVVFVFFVTTLTMKSLIFSNGAEIDGMFALSIILLSYFVLSKVPIINKALELFGKHSGSIFMFHTFLIKYYFESAFYSLKYSLLIFVVSVCICLLVAVCIELIKKYTCYNKLIKSFLD